MKTDYAPDCYRQDTYTDGGIHIYHFAAFIERPNI